MTRLGFQFDADQAYQLDAISSVVDLFEGQPKDVEKLFTPLRGLGMINDSIQSVLDMDLSHMIGAVGNRLILDRDLIVENLQRVQDRNGLEVVPHLYDNALDFDIEMETGTGKTYVYLRTIFELAVKYNFTKFIILVPSVAIREGVSTSIRLMRPHFENLYRKRGVTFDSSIYNGKTAEEVQSFATSTNVHILILTISSIRERIKAKAGNNNKSEDEDPEGRLILNRRRDKLNGFRPIDYLRATYPVVIMDEPQNMESDASADALSRLNPVFTLRYSATHTKQRNVVYRLDPVDAHDLGLVKQIVVADVRQEGADATPYIKLIGVRREPGWVAQLELAVRKADASMR